MNEPTTKQGQCRDCGQGVLFPGPGFALYGEEGVSWWYCRWCGSNHVDLKDEEGNVIQSQGDLCELGTDGTP